MSESQLLVPHTDAKLSVEVLGQGMEKQAAEAITETKRADRSTRILRVGKPRFIVVCLSYADLNQLTKLLMLL